MTGPRYALASVDSTQRMAIEYVRRGGAAGVRFVAARQGAGIGRADHAWSSPPGGLYLSMVEPEPSAISPLLPLAIGLELAEGLRARFGVLPWLKWPNDLLLAPTPGPARKLAGLLVDRVMSATGPALVIGIGLNVRAPSAEFSPELRPRVISLADVLPGAPSVADAEEVAVAAVHRALASFANGHPTPSVVERCSARLYGVGRPALVDGEPAGTIQGLTEDGSLALASEGRRVLVRTGDLAIVEAA